MYGLWSSAKARKCWKSKVTSNITHTVLLTFVHHQFTFLIGQYAVAEIWYFIKKRDENDKNKFMMKNSKKISKKYMKALSNEIRVRRYG